MVSESASSTRASVISVDPAVMSQITANTQDTSPLGHSRTRSISAKRLRTPETVSSSRGHARNQSAPLQSSGSKKGLASLRRAKNSTEVLRQKSSRSIKKPTTLKPIPDTREGRSFTVGNVGTGGVLYLKPSVHQNASLHTSPLVLMPLTAPADLPSMPNDENLRPSTKPATRSDAPSTAVRSASPKRPTTKYSRRPTTETARSRYGRSQSFSTVEEQRPSFAGSRTKTLKIVINRPGDVAKPKASQEIAIDPPKLSLPTLEVPIPHYKIGTPRFSDHGTAMLRSSIARSSATPSEVTQTEANTHSQHFRGPPPSHAKAFARMESAHQQTTLDGDRARSARPTTSSGSAKTDSTIREPIHPEIYDDLANMYDDPAVVRYAQNPREVTAATPARIIAQISSESFMDYELVSDFFLTFRSYMSTFIVLDLLLARLRWAINRQEDDGRIIRVRTFAALRHWILNYFVDDFMVDQKLRVRFCNEINKMYAEVSSRPSSGTSDLKVLRDLKRCWNGRCSMFWDPDDFNLDGEQEEDLHPGGYEDDNSEGHTQRFLQLPTPSPRMKTASNSSWFEVPPNDKVSTQHERQTSTGKQESIVSEQSIQAKSCSIPKGFLRPNDDLAAHEQASHPVPVQLRRKNAPATLQVQTGGHRRGAASIDSDREPTPREASTTSMHFIYTGSVIRGSVFGPSAPFVQIVSSPTVSSVARFEANNVQPHTGRRNGSPHSAQGAPGVKNIFGSLRKALGGRHGHSDMALVTVSAPMPFQEPPKLQRTPLPLNMSRSHDELRNKTSVPQKAQIRIDLLCAQVGQSYASLFPSENRPQEASSTQQNPFPLLIKQTFSDVDPALLTPDLRRDRLPSHTTAQSGSILIVNDTGMGMPAMSGAVPSASSMQYAWQEGQANDAAYGLGISQERRGSLVPATTQRSSDALGENIAQESSADQHEASHTDLRGFRFPVPGSPQQVRSPRTQRTASTTGSSSTLRHRKSYQSSPRPEPSVATVTSVSMADPELEEEEEDDQLRMPAHALRRKPGGDLRKVENVHDLDRDNHHESLETTTTASGSPIHSFTAAGEKVVVQQQQQPRGPEKKQVSMINTHSSQHLRPSFEAAVAGFSHIPDDNDGGYEATLLKLEGRYEKQSPPMDQHPIDTTDRRRSMPEIRTSMPLGSPVSAEDADVHTHFEEPSSAVDRSEDVEERQVSSRKSSIFGLPVASEPGSRSSYDSIPLLKRDTMNQSQTKIIPSPLHLQKAFDKNASQQRLQAELTRSNALSLPRPDTANESAQSFLLDEDEDLSDLSSEISVDIINYTHGMDRSISPMIAAPGTAISGLEIPSHPLTYASVVNLAPTSVDGRDSMLISDARSSQHKVNGAEHSAIQPARMSGGPAHIPFILACDSQVLAQQLTLIEKSALTEIEWFDLVDMRWENSSPKILDWAQCLAKSNIKGVDLVVARFNLVSRWVRSEIVLTQDIDERAAVIAKYIHVAAHARRLHNYATMVQITLGLASSDITRLARTWEKVSGPDRSLLRNMERLVQPVRNFQDLRAEIEGSDFSDGCIPFIGLYVHDLTGNASKPAQLSSDRGSEPLINFERYRKAAEIVKGLLRLIDASARYTFEPVKGIVERCLWLAGLEDGDIRGLSRGLEQ